MKLLSFAVIFVLFITLILADFEKWTGINRNVCRLRIDSTVSGMVKSSEFRGDLFHCGVCSGLLKRGSILSLILDRLVGLLSTVCDSAFLPWIFLLARARAVRKNTTSNGCRLARYKFKVN